MIQNRKMSAALTTVAISLAFIGGNMSLAVDQTTNTDVFVSGKGGYHTFRIPAAIVTPKGTVLAFCEGRKTSRSDHGDLDLLLRRSTDNGKTWTPIQIVYEEGGDAKITIGNPCPVIEQSTGRIWLPFCRNNDQVLVTYSDDDGETWTKPLEITQSVKESDWSWYATGPGVGIQLTQGKHKGRLVIPCDHRKQNDSKKVTYSHAFYSDDNGKTWKLGETVSRHTNECQVAELSDGTLMMNMRNYWGPDGNEQDKDKMRAVATSRDGGQTWENLRFDQTLIEPICQASLLRYSTKGGNGHDRLMFSNPASKTTRHRLTVRLSNDAGKTWPLAKLLHKGPSAYSCLTVLPDGSICCLYEGGEKSAYEKIIFACFSLASLNKAKEAEVPVVKEITGLTSLQAGDREALDRKVQPVIDEVDKLCRERTVYMIGPVKAKRLAALVHQKKPRLVVECGTAIGYSGLWIARELKANGHGKLITIEIDESRAKQALANFERAGLADVVDVRVGDARQLVSKIEGPIDFVFIDCNYSNYYPCFQGLEKQLAPGAVVVADNVGIGAAGMKDYLDHVRSKYRSKTEWFDIDLPWGKRDAMVITIIEQKGRTGQ